MSMGKTLNFLDFWKKVTKNSVLCKKYPYICGVKILITMGRTVTASLGPHYEEFIQNSIQGGRYNNVSEVIRAGLRRLEEDESRLVALKMALEEGESSPDVVDFDAKAFLEELKAERKKNG